MDNVAEAIADLKRQLAALEATVAPAPQTETLFPDAEPDDTAEPEVTLADWLDHRGITNYQTVAALVRWAAAAPLPTTATHKAWATICTPERGVPLEWVPGGVRIDPAATTMDVVVAISELHDSHHRATS